MAQLSLALCRTVRDPLKTHSTIHAVTAIERQTHSKLREPEMAFADAVVARKELTPRPPAAHEHPNRAGYRK
ncbi:hypothetical protein, partial [Streptomyces mirabilis]